MIYLTGDKHQNIFELSFKNNRFMREVTAADTLFILGDFGVIWNWNGDTKEEAYILGWLNSQAYTTIVILGNHENWVKILNMPQIEKFGGKVRECVYGDVTYEKIFFVTEPTTLDIDGKHILAIPGADSHDIDHLLDPAEKDFKRIRKYFNRKNIWYRIIGQSWWPQEAIDINATRELLNEHELDHFDMILTHDAPAGINQWYDYYTGFRMKSTDGELFFEELAWTLDYDAWFHGHFHFDGAWVEHNYNLKVSNYWYRMGCLYHDVIGVD